jgi:hypothetical protein
VISQGADVWCSRRAAGSAEDVGQLAAEPGVLVDELFVAVESSGEPGAQRRVGCPLVFCRSLRIWSLISGWV